MAKLSSGLRWYWYDCYQHVNTFKVGVLFYYEAGIFYELVAELRNEQMVPIACFSRFIGVRANIKNENLRQKPPKMR